MKILLTDVKFPPHLNLGFVCGFDENDMSDRDYKIKSWAPKQAKSYSILSQFFDKDKRGWIEGHAEIAYFSKLKEGNFPLDKSE